MTSRARSCIDCNLADFSEEKLICTKGHKPRFYLPKGTYPRYENDWGYKRRCNDYKHGCAKGITKQTIKANL